MMNENIINLLGLPRKNQILKLRTRDPSWGNLPGKCEILQLCNDDCHNVVIIYVPIYHTFY